MSIYKQSVLDYKIKQYVMSGNLFEMITCPDL